MSFQAATPVSATIVVASHHDGGHAEHAADRSRGRSRPVGGRIERRARRSSEGGRRSRLDTVEPIEDGQRFFRRRAAVDRRLEQTTSFVAFAALEGGDAILQQLFGFTLPLGEGAACPVDVGARPRMAAVEKERARPDIDGELVAAGEVVVETDQQELLDLGGAIRSRRDIRVSARGVGTKRIGHRV